MFTKIIFGVLIFCATSVYGQNVKVLGVDYNFSDETIMPFSVGISTWSDEKADNDPIGFIVGYSFGF